MDKRIEIVDALLDLSRASKRVARLISQGAFGNLKEELPTITVGNSKEIIDIDLFEKWPAADYRCPAFSANLDDLTVLEWSANNAPVTVSHKNAKRIDLIAGGAYPFTHDQPANVRVLNSTDNPDAKYDVGVIWETAEFLDDPTITILTMAKCCHKIYIRFRPWTSRDGAFTSGVVNRAFAHLVINMDHKVKHQVIRPLATYEQIIKNSHLPIHERRINTTQPEEFFSTNTEVMRVLCERTWGKIDTDQALKIMATDSVDYVLGYSV